MARVVVAYNDDVDRKTHLNEVERIGEAESGETAREIASLLDAELLPVRELLPALHALKGAGVVINLCEGLLGNPRFEMHFALALEMLRIPFTGCDPIAVGLCTDKAKVKRLLRSRGIPVPADEGERVIVKPSREDAGIGIEAAAVCRTKDEIAARVRWVEETYRQPALVEEFIDGRELNQSIYLGKVLPPGEVVFADDLRAEERVVGWMAKWAEGSREDLATRNRTPAHIDDGTRDALARICLDAYETLGIGGYARFDVRERGGELFLVDINPNPDLGRGTGFRRSLDAAGIAFPVFLNELMMAATARRRA